MEPSILQLISVALWLIGLLGSHGLLAQDAQKRIAEARESGLPGPAIHGFASASGTIVGFAAVLCGMGIGGILGFADDARGAAGCLILGLSVGWLVRDLMRRQRRVVGAVQGPEWDNDYQTTLIVLMMGPLLAVPIGAASLAILGHLGLAAIGSSMPAWVAALLVYPAFFLATLWLRRVAQRTFRDPGSLPPEVVRHLDAALGAGASESMAVLSTGDAAFHNALSLRLGDGSGKDVWISSSLLEVLPADEAAAVLVHEMSHLERRDDLRRAGTALALHGLAIAGLAFIGNLGLGLSCLAFVVAYFVSITLLAQPQELRADARAKEVGLGHAMGRALVAIHRLHRMPRELDNEAFLTHPLLAKRLAALGLELPEPSVEEAPVRRRGRLRATLTWLGLVLVLSFAFALAKRLP